MADTAHAKALWQDEVAGLSNCKEASETGTE